MRERLLSHIDAAANRLQARRSISDEDVHEARKSIKRARATLRLLQPALDTHDTERSRMALRDAGRTLASVRDAKVLVDRFDEMLRRLDIDAFAVSTVSAPVASRARAAAVRAAARHRGDPVAAYVGLVHARQWLTEASLTATGWAPLAEGLRAVYKSGRRGLPADADAASTEALHEWRKRVKDLLHALESLAGPKRSTPVRRLIGSARRLADILGEEHDLALLADALRASDQAGDVRVARLLGGIAVRRRRLRRRAVKLGSELYAEPPSAMVKRLRRLLNRDRSIETQS